MSSENMKMVPSLQDLCLVQAAVTIANHPDIKEMIFSRNMEDCTLIICESQLQIWNKCIQKRLPRILENIPYRLREKISVNLITLISIKMVAWAKYHEVEFGLSLSFSKKFITTSLFTTKGTIDKEKAARVLVSDKSVSLSIRYKIACSYCLADVIPSLYLLMSEEEKAKYKTYENSTPLSEMMVFWDHYMRKEVKSLLKKGIEETSDSVYTYAYSIAWRCRNDIAVLNCWKNLSSRERKRVIDGFLVKISPVLAGPTAYYNYFFLFCEPYLEMVSHLFSHSDRELRSRLVSSDISFNVLKCFLNWPNQELFLEAVELAIGTLPKFRYYSLLHEVVDKLESRNSDTYNYKFLLRELWKLGSQDYIRYVLGVREAGEHQTIPEAGEYDSLKYECLIEKLFELKNFTSEDEENVRLILSNATSDEKVEISLIQGNNICHSAIIAGNFDLADLFIECCLERERVGDFKSNFISSFHGGFLFKKVMFEENLELAEKLLNWALKQNEIEKFKSNAISLIPINSIKEYHRKDSNSSVNCIENFIKWATPSADIENCKKEYLLQSDFLLDYYRFSCGELMEIQQFLQWFFATEESIKTFKKDLAFKLLQSGNEYFDIIGGLRFVDTFVKWCNFTEEERITFTRRFAYKDSVLERSSEYAINHELNEIDRFITWTKLPKGEVALFKRHLIFSFKKIHTTYRDLITKGIQDEVDNFIGWSELPEHDVEQFKKLLASSQEKQVIFNVKVFQSIAKLLVEEEDDSVIEDSFKFFVTDLESLNRFRDDFLMWFTVQSARNNCVNCGGSNFNIKHTYNLQGAPVFCYNVMSQTAEPHHMNRFKVLVEAVSCKLVIQKELSLSDLSGHSTSESGQGTGASCKGTSEYGLGIAASGEMTSASRPATTVSSNSASASGPGTTVYVKKSSKSEPAMSAPCKKTYESGEMTTASDKRTYESELGTTSDKKTCKTGPVATASGKRKGTLGSGTSKKRKL